jgi:hypothetical protein
VASRGIVFLFVILEETFYTIEDDVICEHAIYGLYYDELVSFYKGFVEKFYHEVLLKFSNTFSASIELIIKMFTLFCLSVVAH